MTAISAHRRDETGLAGIAAAVESGAEYVELDVRLTGDGVLVVHHDRATRDGIALSRSPYDRLRGADGGPLPRVDEAVQTIAPRAKGHIDLKERGCEHAVVELALEAFGADRFVVTTRDLVSIREIKKSFPQVRTALSVGRSLWEPGVLCDLAPVRLLRSSGADMVALNFRMARLGVLGQCARAGFPAMVWTVNAEPDMRRFLGDHRVEVLVTDHPAAALRLREDPVSR
ncbi:glycerophosphodiester phosphodiesterase [Spirillospora sp. CA-294931]|uniref:glycerophosphodiester phosphodiesterase n=1 Tax=Spirillospora sp. CA-294931 TaxID=3240042 RepID=UPI003D92D3FA